MAGENLFARHISIAQFMRNLKGKSTLMIFDNGFYDSELFRPFVFIRIVFRNLSAYFLAAAERFFSASTCCIYSLGVIPNAFLKHSVK